MMEYEVSVKVLRTYPSPGSMPYKQRVPTQERCKLDQPLSLGLRDMSMPLSLLFATNSGR